MIYGIGQINQFIELFCMPQFVTVQNVMVQLKVFHVEQSYPVT